MLKIQEHIIKHGLNETVNKFKLNFKDCGHKIMLKYDQIESSNQYEEVHEARGLVLEKNTWNILSMPFKRFFNYGDHYASKLDEKRTVYLEKRDGTLIQVYWDKVISEWCVNTMFSEANEFISVDNIKTDMTHKSLFLKKSIEYNSDLTFFDKDNTYIFELTSPYNKVVVDYDKIELRLIGCRNLNDLIEYNFDELNAISKQIKIPLVENYEFNSIEDCLNSFYNYNDSFNFEGYVAFDGINRVKIKNPAYVVVHLTKRNINEIDLSKPYMFLDIVKQNEIDEFILSFPNTKDLINNMFDKYNRTLLHLNTIKSILGIPKIITDKKEFANNIFTLLEEYNLDKNFSSVFFMLNENKFKSIEEFVRKMDNKKLFNLIRF
jgi:hypothetical protein